MRTTDEPKQCVLRIRITQKMFLELKAIAKQNDISMSKLIREMLNNHIKNFEKL